MSESERETVRLPNTSAQFTATHWSVVLAAKDANSPQADDALARLCRTYWYPLYAYVRRRGHSSHDAQDLTQEFFARLLEKNYLKAVDRAKGKFRSFLLTAMGHFLAKEWVRGQRQKRGGGQVILSLDDDTAEDRYRLEPGHDLTPEKIYERRWALTLLEQAMNRLRDECQAGKKAALFEQVKSVLGGERPDFSYAEASARLGMSDGALTVAVHRLRQRYGELLQEEVAQTVSSPAEMEEEIRHLFSVLSR